MVAPALEQSRDAMVQRAPLGRGGGPAAALRLLHQIGVGGEATASRKAQVGIAGRAGNQPLHGLQTEWKGSHQQFRVFLAGIDVATAGHRLAGEIGGHSRRRAGRDGGAGDDNGKYGGELRGHDDLVIGSCRRRLIAKRTSAMRRCWMTGQVFFPDDRARGRAGHTR